ncbi:hypothetical protein C5F47_07290 [Nitrosopumilus cobalaminigenes]|uniref:Uncharacterized protein n=1 Tax=Nitrosopumilus cobalaminigenes TaxID=1470066 RepID=A0A7D5R8V9_9ARCH|nr:hypothetical protein [Nitrosopumilus cobalaminigenes]QLH03363.1 hypothetical protein C5F47_07290 [Nitrosopumilus cobalaminigenes]
MADPNFSWIYIVIFLAIPLARIIPRLLAKKGIGKSFIPQQQKQFESASSDSIPEQQAESFESRMDTSKPQSKNELVLGALNRGSHSFEKIQKNTGLDSQDLDSILEDLEKNGLLKVVQKQGLFGPKTELYPTDKGFKEYYS